MNITLEKTIGIDKVIEEVQTDLYNYLIDKWTSNIDGFGRAYINLGDNGYVAQYYVAENDYRDVYFNDERDAQFFFLADTETQTKDEYIYETKCKIVFMLNLDRVYGSTMRKDEQARVTVIDFLRKVSYNNFTINGYSIGIKEVFKGLDTTKINKVDLHPLHAFSVNVTMYHYITDNCN